MSKNNNFGALNSVQAISMARRAPAMEKGIPVIPKVLSHMEKCESMQVAHDPYYQHIPKNDAVAATIYAANMGGEHHEINNCEIM